MGKLFGKPLLPNKYKRPSANWESLRPARAPRMIANSSRFAIAHFLKIKDACEIRAEEARWRPISLIGMSFRHHKPDGPESKALPGQFDCDVQRV
ncbi:hypothetical protein [Massilia forsythiae]|uniref:hypothetical protein n=1 Tax=Massilia forsythiae TaxID=2728020 RepID=UPI001E5EC44E|nr:hypothetical protein [Massilia forsythiae]